MLADHRTLRATVALSPHGLGLLVLGEGRNPSIAGFSTSRIALALPHVFPGESVTTAWLAALVALARARGAS